MIELTEEQAQAIANAGETPPLVVDPWTNTTYVLLRKDLYERLACDDSPWTNEERDTLRAEALDELGWEGMEAYQDNEACLEHRTRGWQPADPTRLAQGLQMAAEGRTVKAEDALARFRRP